MRTVLGIVIGGLGGFFGGLVGLGGGVVMVPLLTGVAKLTQHKAHGTSLLAIMFTSLAGAATYYYHGAADWLVAVLLAVTAIVTARIGALYAHSLPERKLKKAFGYFLMFVSASILIKGLLPSTSQEPMFLVRALIFLLTGAATGFLSGMLGVGGGTVMIPPMVLLAGMPQHLAQGTSLLAMVPISVAGTWTHHRLGNLQPDLAVGLIVGALVGGYFGGTAANLLPEIYLKVLFVAVMIYVALRYIRL